MNDLEALRRELAAFAEARDWNQFHSPKNLAMALSVEASELVEIFQWLTEDESRNLQPATLGAAADEIADIQIYLVRIADKLGIDILQATRNKFVKNEAKYPVERSRGTATKYTELD